MMRRSAAILAFAVVSTAAAAASAGTARCWVDNGAVVVSAAIGDIAGDFFLDLSAPRSLLHVTTAQADGFGDSGVMAGTLSLAGERIPAQLTVADLDARERGYPTTIDGIIGADALAGYVVDLQLEPCRLSLSRRGPRRRGVRLPLRLMSGVPTAPASITDGRSGLAGWFAIDTGAAGVRISDKAAQLSRSPKGIDPASRMRPPARLAALGLGGEALTDLSAGTWPDAPDGVLGAIGTDVWSRYDLVVDFRRGALVLSAPRSARSGGSSRRAARRR